MPNEKVLKVGCCGFPVGLTRYTRLFPVVEVQQTFYQPPRAETLQRWRSTTPAAFEFTIKAWQLITHEAASPTYRRLREPLTDHQKQEAGSFRPSRTVMEAWCRTLQCAVALRSRAILFQCPPRFAPTQENISNLRRFFHAIRELAEPEAPLPRPTYIWEPRGSWARGQIGELCEELGLVHAVDPFAEQAVTTGMGYFRLHGRQGFRYQYSDTDLMQLLRSCESRDPCYVLFNNASMLADSQKFLRLAGDSE
jgi:uncharacterized protein YecE (DUF72 family)